MAHFDKPIAQLIWPKERFSTPLCAKCGDSLHLDLHELKYPEILHSVRSRHSPVGKERAIYLKLVDDAQKTMERCQSELRRIQDLSRALEEQQDLLKAYLAGLHSIISPINRLPQEVLGDIFQNVCCGDIGANFVTHSRKYLPTITISRVCIGWYNIVVSMSVLWSSFGTTFSESPYTLPLFDLFLKRSRLHPIDFKVDNIFSSTNSLLSLTDIKNTNRWRHVVIRVLTKAVDMLQPLIDGRHELPTLTSLTLYSELYEESSFPLNCSNLRSLTLSGVFLQLEYSRTTLTTLKLACLSAQKACRIILHCPNVQDLTVSRIEIGATDVPPINLTSNTPKLTVVHDNSSNDLPHFYDSLSLPELTRLELSNPWQASIGTHHVGSLCTMLERSSCYLTHLVIHSIPFTSNELLCLFLRVTSVTTLEVIDNEASSESISRVLKVLIASAPGEQSENESGSSGKEEKEFAHGDITGPDGQCLLPQLTHLTVVLKLPIESHLLVKLVRSRRPLLLDHFQRTNNKPCVTLQKLQTISLQDSDFQWQRSLDMLRKSLEPFVKDGMDVAIDVLCTRYLYGS